MTRFIPEPTPRLLPHAMNDDVSSSRSTEPADFPDAPEEDGGPRAAKRMMFVTCGAGALTAALVLVGWGARIGAAESAKLDSARRHLHAAPLPREYAVDFKPFEPRRRAAVAARSELEFTRWDDPADAAPSSALGDDRDDDPDVDARRLEAARLAKMRAELRRILEAIDALEPIASHGRASETENEAAFFRAHRAGQRRSLAQRAAALQERIAEKSDSFNRWMRSDSDSNSDSDSDSDSNSNSSSDSRSEPDFTLESRFTGVGRPDHHAVPRSPRPQSVSSEKEDTESPHPAPTPPGAAPSPGHDSSATGSSGHVGAINPNFDYRAAERSASRIKVARHVEALLARLDQGHQDALIQLAVATAD